MEILESTKNIDSLLNLLKSNDIGLVNMAFLFMRKQLKKAPLWLKSCAFHVSNEEVYLFKTSDGYYFFNKHLESMVLNEYHVFTKTIDGVAFSFILDTKTKNVYDFCFKHIITIPQKFNVKSNTIFKKGNEWFFAETEHGVGLLKVYDRFGTELMGKQIPKSHFIVGYEKGAIKMGGLRNGGFKRLKVPKF